MKIAIHSFSAAVPDPHPDAPPGIQAKVDVLLNLLMYGGLVCVVAGFIAAGITLAISHGRGHGGGREGVDAVMKVCLGAMIIGAASSLAGWLL